MNSIKYIGTNPIKLTSENKVVIVKKDDEFNLTDDELRQIRDDKRFEKSVVKSEKKEVKKKIIKEDE